MIVVAVDPEVAESDLAAGQIDCPRCGCGLRPWGYARRRMVRGVSGPVWLRPRRAWCAGCGRTQVLLPASCVPRRRDQAETIGSALLANATGQGHRPIAARLAVPEATVRGWLRRARARAESARHVATRWAHALDANLPAIQPQGSPLADALEAAGAAIRGAVLLGITTAPPWHLLHAVTGGRLLAPARSG